MIPVVVYIIQQTLAVGLLAFREEGTKTQVVGKCESFTEHVLLLLHHAETARRRGFL
jgi:hypothetical protein